MADDSLFDLDRHELNELLGDQPAYRQVQIWQGLYRDFSPLEEITTLPKALRAQLAKQFPASLTEMTQSRSATGDTVKWLWQLPDQALIETVLMVYEERCTVCVSTQAGCAMACGFCATGQAGFTRNLSSGEIVEQVVSAARHAKNIGRRVSNIVFMGMGEPFANYDRTMQAVRKIHGDIGISARHLTLSTVGIIPGIVRLSEEELPVNLAISLHAANDELRNELVPINRRYPLDDLFAACQTYTSRKNRRLSFEWALIENTNDRPQDAEELAAFALPLRAHVNLIPLNRTPGWPTTGSSPKRVEEFVQMLKSFGVNATVRANRGTDIDAACGQLRASYDAETNVVPPPTFRPRT